MAIRQSQSAISLRLNGVEMAILWNLFVKMQRLALINQQNLPYVASVVKPTYIQSPAKTFKI